nr:hypothetical protein [Crucivirus sp.]
MISQVRVLTTVNYRLKKLKIGTERLRTENLSDNLYTTTHSMLGLVTPWFQSPLQGRYWNVGYRGFADISPCMKNLAMFKAMQKNSYQDGCCCRWAGMFGHIEVIYGFQRTNALDTQAYPSSIYCVENHEVDILSTPLVGKGGDGSVNIKKNVGRNINSTS